MRDLALKLFTLYLVRLSLEATKTIFRRIHGSRLRRESLDVMEQFDFPEKFPRDVTPIIIE